MQGRITQITISTRTLRQILLQYTSSVTREGRWQLMAGILATLVATLLVSDFKKALGINGDVWQALFVAAAIVCVIFFVVFFRQSKTSSGVDGVMDEIIKESRISEKRLLLIVFVAKDSEGVARFLVERDGWNKCYYLPWVQKHAEIDDVDQILKYLNYKVPGVFKDPLLTEMSDFATVSQQMSRTTGEQKLYHFQFFALQPGIVAKREILTSPSHIAGGEFRWATADELLAHPSTRERNHLVFKHISTQMWAEILKISSNAKHTCQGNLATGDQNGTAA